MQGERYGRFVLLECIGRGGMAEVFRAVAHGVERFSRVFVVKRIQREHASTPELVEMFANEARISALLNHPNIVQVYDFGQLDGSYFISMEYLRGKDLLAVLRQLRSAGRLMPPALAAFVAREVAAGLAYAHQLVAPGGRSLEIIHRDVSPSNVMLLRAGGVKLLDFGIAKASAALQDGGHTTATGMVKGKLSYLSPEQVRHETVDARTDIFSLGVVLWECLTGKRLFHDRSDYHTMNNVLSRTVPAPSTQQAGVPPALDAIVLKMLERDRDRRTSTAKALVEELDSFLVTHPLPPRTLPRLLDELFGADGHELESVPPVTTGARPSDEETPIMTAVMLPTVPSLAAVAAVTTGSRSEGLLPASSSDGLPRATKSSARVWPWAAGAAMVVAAFAAGRMVRSPVDTGIVRIGTPRATTSPVVSVASDVAPGLAQAAATTRGQGAAAGIESLSATVSLRVESDPAGAEVTGPAGTLGSTPLSIDVARGTASVTLVLNKPGFAPARQTITPDRDVTAMVNLRALPATRTPRKGGPAAAGETASRAAAVGEAASPINETAGQASAPTAGEGSESAPTAGPATSPATNPPPTGPSSVPGENPPAAQPAGGGASPAPATGEAAAKASPFEAGPEPSNAPPASGPATGDKPAAAPSTP